MRAKRLQKNGNGLIIHPVGCCFEWFSNELRLFLFVNLFFLTTVGNSTAEWWILCAPSIDENVYVTQLYYVTLLEGRNDLLGFIFSYFVPLLTQFILFILKSNALYKNRVVHSTYIWETSPPAGIGINSYVDDCIIFPTGTSIPQLVVQLNIYLQIVSTWLKKQPLDSYGVKKWSNR